jgi:hypothetical protein
MTLTPDHHAEILSLLETCFVSTFNVAIRDDGLVLFHGNGLTRDEIDCARYMLVKYLLSLQ